MITSSEQTRNENVVVHHSETPLTAEERVEMTIMELRYAASDLLKLRMANDTADYVMQHLGDLYAVNGVLGSIAEDIRTNLPVAAE